MPKPNNAVVINGAAKKEKLLKEQKSNNVDNPEAKNDQRGF